MGDAAAMLEGHSRVIGGREWTVTLLLATRGIEIGRRLVKLFAPAFIKAIGAVGASDKLLDTNIGALVGSFGDLAEHLGDPDAAAIVKELVTTNVSCNGTPVTATTFEIVFAGDYMTMLEVAWFAIEVNYKRPFLSWLAVLQEKQRAQKSAKPTAPPVAR